MRRHLIYVLLVGGCGTGAIGTPGGGGGDDTPPDVIAPALLLTAPERGTMTADPQIVVTGDARDLESGLASVTVNGVAATVDGGGHFSASLPLTPGLAIIETIATDVAGNHERDVRAVLAGTLAPVEAEVTDALAGKIGPSGFAVISAMISGLVNEIDITAVATARNPVVDEGGSCLGVKVNVESVNKSGALITLTPGSGAVVTHAEIHDADVQLRANFKVACIGGSAGVRIRASNLRIDGELGLGLDGTTLAASVGGVSVALDGFDLDVGSIPGVIVDLFEGPVKGAVSSALSDAISNAVPGMTEDMLAELTGGNWSIGVLGQTVDVGFAPRVLTIDPTGLYIDVDAGLTIAAGGGVDYLASPATPSASLMTGADSLGVAVADDLFNQLLAGMWATRALEQGLDLPPGHPAQIFFGPEADRIEIEFALPPTVSADGNGELRLMLGDLIVRVIDSDTGKGTLCEMALSASVGFSTAIGADGRLAVTIGSPTLWAQVLESRDDLPVTFGDEQAKALGELMFTQVGDLANQALGALPIPLIGDAVVQDASMESAAGYLVMKANLGL